MIAEKDCGSLAGGVGLAVVWAKEGRPQGAITKRANMVRAGRDKEGFFIEKDLKVGCGLGHSAGFLHSDAGNG